MVRWRNEGARFTPEDGADAGRVVEEGGVFEADVGSICVRRRRHKLVRAGPDPDREPDPLYGIDFGSEAAEEKAREAGLRARDFFGREGSGSGGSYLVDDVEVISGG